MSDLAEQVRRHLWFHSIDFENGIVTPGYKSLDIHAKENSAFFGPVRLKGQSVIDIGAWNGAYSFEAKRRGASRVLANDHFVWNDPGWRGREAFDLARSALGLEIETLDADIGQLSIETVGTFDVVLFLGVFYHLFDPIEALTRVSKLVDHVLVLETHVDLLDVNRPAMAFYPGVELAGDPTNWWGPNPACIIALLRSLGFEIVDATFSPVAMNRAIFHAWRSRKLRISNGPELSIAGPIERWASRVKRLLKWRK